MLESETCEERVSGIELGAGGDLVECMDVFCDTSARGSVVGRKTMVPAEDEWRSVVVQGR